MFRLALVFSMLASCAFASEPTTPVTPVAGQSTVAVLTKNEVKVDANRLIFNEKGVASLTSKGEKVTVTNGEKEKREETDITRPYSGLVVWEGDGWRVEVPTKDGIADGKVMVFTNNSVMSYIGETPYCDFLYSNGVRASEGSQKPGGGSVEKVWMEEVLRLEAEIKEIQQKFGDYVEGSPAERCANDAIYKAHYERTRRLAEKANQTREPNDCIIFKLMAQTTLAYFKKMTEKNFGRIDLSRLRSKELIEQAHQRHEHFCEQLQACEKTGIERMFSGQVPSWPH